MFKMGIIFYCILLFCAGIASAGKNQYYVRLDQPLPVYYEQDVTFTANAAHNAFVSCYQNGQLVWRASAAYTLDQNNLVHFGTRLGDPLWDGRADQSVILDTRYDATCTAEVGEWVNNHFRDFATVTFQVNHN